MLFSTLVHLILSPKVSNSAVFITAVWNTYKSCPSVCLCRYWMHRHSYLTEQQNLHTVRFRWFGLKCNFSLFFYKNKEKRKGKKPNCQMLRTKRPKVTSWDWAQYLACYWDLIKKQQWTTKSAATDCVIYFAPLRTESCYSYQFLSHMR